MVVELLLIGVRANVVIISLSDVVTGVMIVLECAVPVSYFVGVLPDVMVEALAIGINVEVLFDVKVNVLAAMMPTLELPMPIPAL